MQSLPLPAGRPDRFVAALQAGPLVGDAAKGTALAARLAPGARPGPSDPYCTTAPAAVAMLHAGHVEAGAEAVITNSFSAVRLARDPAYREGIDVLCEAAVRLARSAEPLFVGGAMTQADPALSDAEAAADYRLVASALHRAGADYLQVETILDP